MLLKVVLGIALFGIFSHDCVNGIPRFHLSGLAFAFPSSFRYGHHRSFKSGNDAAVAAGAQETPNRNPYEIMLGSRSKDEPAAAGLSNRAGSIDPEPAGFQESLGPDRSSRSWSDAEVAAPAASSEKLDYGAPPKYFGSRRMFRNAESDYSRSQSFTPILGGRRGRRHHHQHGRIFKGIHGRKRGAGAVTGIKKGHGMYRKRLAPYRNTNFF